MTRVPSLMRSRKVNTGPERLRARRRRGKFRPSRDTPNERKKEREREVSRNSIVPESLFTWTTFREYYATAALSANATGYLRSKFARCMSFTCPRRHRRRPPLFPLSRKPRARDCVSQILFEFRLPPFPVFRGGESRRRKMRRIGRWSN